MRPLFLKFSTNITISFDNNDRDGRIENTVSNVGLCMFKEHVNITEGNWMLK